MTTDICCVECGNTRESVAELAAFFGIAEDPICCEIELAEEEGATCSI